MPKPKKTPDSDFKKSANEIRKVVEKNGALDAVRRHYDSIRLSPTQIKVITQRNKEMAETVLTHEDPKIMDSVWVTLSSPLDEWMFGLYREEKPLAKMMEGILNNVLDQQVDHAVPRVQKTIKGVRYKVSALPHHEASVKRVSPTEVEVEFQSGSLKATERVTAPNSDVGDSLHSYLAESAGAFMRGNYDGKDSLAAFLKKTCDENLGAAIKVRADMRRHEAQMRKHDAEQARLQAQENAIQAASVRQRVEHDALKAYK